MKQLPVRYIIIIINKENKYEDIFNNVGDNTTPKSVHTVIFLTAHTCFDPLEGRLDRNKCL